MFARYKPANVEVDLAEFEMSRGVNGGAASACSERLRTVIKNSIRERERGVIVGWLSQLFMNTLMSSFLASGP